MAAGPFMQLGSRVWDTGEDAVLEEEHLKGSGRTSQSTLYMEHVYVLECVCVSVGNM